MQGLEGPKIVSMEKMFIYDIIQLFSGIIIKCMLKKLIEIVVSH